MKTKYRFIHFQYDEERHIWLCLNTKAGDCLGYVGHYKPWNQNVFFVTNDRAVFSHDCLQDIADFIQRIAADAKQGRLL